MYDNTSSINLIISFDDLNYQKSSGVVVIGLWVKVNQYLKIFISSFNCFLVNKILPYHICIVLILCYEYASVRNTDTPVIIRNEFRSKNI